MQTRASAIGHADPAGWAASGACQDSDPELFFPITSQGPARGQLDKAKAVCACCPVRAQCLEFALDSGQDFGIWGGMSEQERRAMRRSGLPYRRLAAPRS